ncbi:Hypothetical predicted protein [Marmota monax]|uniref:Uncharacterized protein n=1 Tax=Marmota monax TaxID=9995 RepID=A0A5E4CVT7_MARMO|nr:hypothetical protein GHT09_001732 [Marmota monax]VTJ85954.1 Hypothetical predicted protein [Marmota monax]
MGPPRGKIQDFAEDPEGFRHQKQNMCQTLKSSGDDTHTDDRICAMASEVISATKKPEQAEGTGCFNSKENCTGRQPDGVLLTTVMTAKACAERMWEERNEEGC